MDNKDNNDFDMFAIEVDAYCASNDIDDYDLYGELEEEDDYTDCDIDFGD